MSFDSNQRESLLQHPLNYEMKETRCPPYVYIGTVHVSTTKRVDALHVVVGSVEIRVTCRLTFLPIYFSKSMRLVSSKS